MAGTTSKSQQQTKLKSKGATSGSRPQPCLKRGRHRSSSPTWSSCDNSGEQEARHTSKKSRPSRSPSLEMFQPKTLSKINPKQKGKRKHLHTSPVPSDLTSPSSSDSDSWDRPTELYVGKSQSSKHPSSSRMKPDLPPLPAPQLEKLKRREYIDVNTLTSAHMFAPLSSTEPSQQLNLSSRSALSIQPTAAKAKITNLSKWIETWNNFLLATLHFHPHLWPEKLVYQSKFCQCANKFPFSLVMQFDMIVRRKLS